MAAKIKRDAKELVFTFAFIAVWVTAWGFSGKIYESAKTSLDDSGWIEHSHDTPVWIGGDWLAGEYRVCQMPSSLYGKLPNTAHLLCGTGDKVPDMAWPTDFVVNLSPAEEFSLFEQYKSDWKLTEHYFHVLPVSYWGRIDRTELSTFSWRCQKLTNGLECKAIN